MLLWSRCHCDTKLKCAYCLFLDSIHYPQVDTWAPVSILYMMTSSNGNIFCVTGPLCGEFTGHRWIPRTKASDAELWCFLWSAPEQKVEQTIETPVRHCAHYDVTVMKDRFPSYGNSHVKDKTVVRPSYLLRGDPYTGKTTSLYILVQKLGALFVAIAWSLYRWHDSAA